MGSGEVVLTATGRETSPFPEIKTGSDRIMGNTIKRVEKWLIDNAIDEARSRGDNFNLRSFEHINLKNLSQSDKDGAELYLFGDEVVPVYPSFLRPLYTFGRGRGKARICKAEGSRGQGRAGNKKRTGYCKRY